MRIPLPLGYKQHIRIFLIIWLLLLLLGLVESQEDLSILWCVIIAYRLIGVEQWSEEHTDPFRMNISDFALGHLCGSANVTVKWYTEIVR